MYNKREMTHQKYLDSHFFTKEQEQRKDSDSECECDHEYSVFSNGFRTCLTCEEQVRDAVQFVSEEGYEDRVIVQREVRRATDDLRVVIRSVFEDLIFRLSYSQITVANSLEKLFETCETYILPDDTLIKEGKRKHPFQVSARPEGLCAALLRKEVLVHKLSITMAGFLRKISVLRTTNYRRV